MRPVLSVIDPPRFNLLSGIVQRDEHLRVQALVSKAPVETLGGGSLAICCRRLCEKTYMASGLACVARWAYRSRRDPQEVLRMRLRELAANRVRFGYRRLTVLLRREGWQVNAKRIYRL
jgi:HTH-like domain